MKYLIICLMLAFPVFSQSAVHKMTQEQFEVQKQICLLKKQNEIPKTDEEELKFWVLMTKSEMKEYSEDICNIFNAIVLKNAGAGNSDYELRQKQYNYYKNVFSFKDYQDTNFNLFEKAQKTQKFVIEQIEDATGQDAISYVSSF